MAIAGKKLIHWIGKSANVIEKARVGFFVMPTHTHTDHEYNMQAHSGQVNFQIYDIFLTLIGI